MSDLLEAAVGYAAEGRAVLPLHTAIAGRCSCGRADCSSPAKHPRVRHGLHEATTDIDQIRRWWTRWPQGNIGIRTGMASNLVVLDIDIRHRGHHALADLADRDPAVLDTRVIRTGGGGWHLYFTHPDHPVRNSASLLGPGVDVRGDGGYIVAPPSSHASGRTYRIGDVRSIAPLPRSIIDAIRPTLPTHITSSHPGVREGSAWARTAFERELALVATSEPGTRNSTLVRAAFKLGQLVGAGQLDHDVTRQSLVAAANNPGLPLREATATVTRGLTAGAAVPRDRSSCTRPSGW
ncbi:MAG TPA: bifunctional DNA primase/polymerase [Acidimicrobiales bacterium]|jgi:hypothetical protein|nr:bifunctional DNA primase/polymerase [Acidimicrobiales bacterium]